MDKSVLENEDTSSVEPNKLETTDGVIVKTNQIDVLSLPRQKNVPRSEKDKKSPPADEPALDENWLLLARDWQSQPYEKTDIQALLKQTKKRTFWAKFLLGLNVVATLGLIGFFLVGLLQGAFDKATIIYLGVGSLLSPVFVYYEIKIRLRTWQQSCDSPDRAVSNAIAACESSIKYYQLSKYSGVFSVPFVNAYLFVLGSESEKSPWPYIAVFNLFVLLMWFVTHAIQQKRKKELTQLSSV
ncbi:hypothetical protein CMT41_02855 [Colwellia sp. MT41]|uniref:hypothetical protein n=1 Tax=Colwellia sp. MT41 TaxID=58049 RepID=UPI0007178958|nr:hypothetical protein [Colwellia sp. MT41]ALO33772.1 hypothetical protein CMT41_02855 [Colwellia sp. MT41]